MPGYGRCFSPSRHNPRGHSRTKRGWFCLVPSKLDPRSALDSTTAGLGVAPGDQPQPSTVIPDISRRWTRPTRVWIQCASAHCQHNAHQRCWRSGVGLCWRPRRPVSNVNSAQQCPKEESASSITVFLAQSPIVTPWHPDVPHQHNARGGQWAHKARPHCGPNRRTTTSKAGCIRHTLRLRARRTDAARPQSPTVDRHRAQSHSRTKRTWFCLVPSKRNPRLARCSTTAGLGVAPGDQPRPSSGIPGRTQLRAQPTSGTTQRLHARCPHTTCQRRWLPKVELCWRTYVTASNVDYAQQGRNAASASPITVLQAQPTLVASWHPDTSQRHNARGRHWVHKGRLRRCQHEAAPTVCRTHHCSKGQSAAPTTMFVVQSPIVTPRHSSASHRHNARGGHWAHKGRLRRCQHEAAPTVCRTHRGPNKETAAHKTGFALHTLQLRAQATDIVRSQPLTLCRHRAQSHSRTKKASYARCSPGRFPGQAGLNYPYPGLATTTVGPRRPWLTNVAPRQRTTPETGDFALPQRGARTLCSPVRTLHSLVIPKPWPGTPQRNAAVARRTPRTSAARPMILAIGGASSQQRTRQAVDSVSPRPQPWSLPREAAVVPPRRSAVLCPVSRTGNCYPVPVIRCSPETLTKTPRRAACRETPAVCAVPRTRHGARMALAKRWKPIPARSTTVRLTPPYAVGVA